MKRLAPLLLLVGLVASCDLFTDEDPCTLIGCASGLRVDVSELAGSPIQVIVRLPNGPILEAQCVSGADCRSIFFEGIVAGTVEVEVWRGVSEEAEFESFTTQLNYVEVYPNGEDCGPPCRIATVRVKAFGLPESAA